VALPRELVEEAARAAPRDLRDNLNRKVIVSRRSLWRRKAAAFEEAIGRRAGDPAIRQD